MFEKLLLINEKITFNIFSFIKGVLLFLTIANLFLLFSDTITIFRFIILFPILCLNIYAFIFISEYEML